MENERPNGGADAAMRYFSSKRDWIAESLERISERRGLELEGSMPASEEGSGSLGRIAEFCLRGKMIRGCLVALGATAKAAPGSAAGDGALARLAAAMELFQAGLLAHDDIMDRDEKRRGAPTLHARYAVEALARGSSDYLHVGESLGICLGDLCYFEAFRELALALAGNPRSGEILALCAGILSEVVLAQMADVRWGSVADEVPEEDILAMYRSKTARYSFSLPLSVGALYADHEDLVAPFIALGERLGILFQLRDDELGLFGDEAATGKGQASDLREGKKTLFRARLFAAAPRAEMPRLAALFGGGFEAKAADIAYIRRLSEELGVQASMRELARGAEAEARAIVGGIEGLGLEAREALEGLVDYVTGRDR